VRFDSFGCKINELASVTTTEAPKRLHEAEPEIVPFAGIAPVTTFAAKLTVKRSQELFS
jgi:hypothetical protein